MKGSAAVCLMNGMMKCMSFAYIFNILEITAEVLSNPVKHPHHHTDSKIKACLKVCFAQIMMQSRIFFRI